MQEPNLDLICKRCSHCIIGMSMKTLNNGKIDHTMLCHRCDADKFDTIYIKKTIIPSGPKDDSGEPLMPKCKYWSAYKYKGQIVGEENV